MRVDTKTKAAPLRMTYESGNLCLFVGAGGSKGCNLPDWAGLVGGIIEHLRPTEGKPTLRATAAAFRNNKPPPYDPTSNWGQKERCLESMNPSIAARFVRQSTSTLNTMVTTQLYSKPIKLSATLR